MALSATVEDEVKVPAKIEAMDGIESREEAHNMECPARRSLKKKGFHSKSSMLVILS